MFFSNYERRFTDMIEDYKHYFEAAKIGTKMLCTSEGKILGTIGGGLMEAQVIKKAEEMFTKENFFPILLKFNLTAGELSEEGEVCGGVIEIFIESVS